jgi:hypothetical protein
LLATGVGVGVGDAEEIGVGVGLAGCVVPELLTLPHPEKTNNVIAVQRIRNNNFALIRAPLLELRFASIAPSALAGSYLFEMPRVEAGSSI